MGRRRTVANAPEWAVREVRLIRRTAKEGERTCAGSSGSGDGIGWRMIPSKLAAKLTLAGYAHVYAEVTKEHGLRVVVELTTLGALLAMED